MAATRESIIHSIASYGLKNKLPLDAAAVMASEMLMDNNLPTDEMEVLMADIQKVALTIKHKRK